MRLSGVLGEVPVWRLTAKKGQERVLQKWIPSLIPQLGPPSRDRRANWVSSEGPGCHQGWLGDKARALVQPHYPLAM